jgi:hypothetical protein
MSVTPYRFMIKFGPKLRELPSKPNLEKIIGLATGRWPGLLLT